MAVGEIFGKIGGGFGANILTNAIIVLLGIGVICGCGFGVYYWVYKKKHWNIKVELKMIRSDYKLIDAEWGKGFYDVSKGVCYIKRKGRKPIPMKPFSINKYLQGRRNILTVVQISPEEFLPILPTSFIEMEDDETGETAILEKIKTDTSMSKAWKSNFERQAKEAYTIINLLKQYAQYIGLGIVLFMNFAGFAILYSKVT